MSETKCPIFSATGMEVVAGVKRGVVMMMTKMVKPSETLEEEKELNGYESMQMEM